MDNMDDNDLRRGRRILRICQTGLQMHDETGGGNQLVSDDEGDVSEVPLMM